MKQFIKRTILYVLLLSSLLFCLLAVSSFVVKERHFQNYETESNLLVWNKNEQVFWLGTIFFLEGLANNITKANMEKIVPMIAKLESPS